MANAFSIPQSMGQYVDPVNEGLISQVLQSKDKKYDYNVAKIDSLVQQYTNLPLLRAEDREYLKNRLDTVLNTVNHVSKLDMSNNNLTRQIEQTIGTAIDDHVITQMGISKSISNFEQGVAKTREKHPELYSDVNYTYAKKMAGVDDYMRGYNSKGEKVDAIGNLQYTDYKDVNKKLDSFIKDIYGMKKDQVVNIKKKDPVTGEYTGEMEKITISGLTPVQVKELAESQLDASDMNQIKINGWSNVGGYENVVGISDSIHKVLDVDINSAEAQKKILENKLVPGISEETRASVQRDLDTVSKNYTSFTKQRDYLLKNPEAAATYLEKQKLIADTTEAFGGLYSETTQYVKDDYWFAKEDLNIKKLTLQHTIDKDNKAAGLSAANTIVNTLQTTTENNIPEIESYIDKTVVDLTTKVNTDLKSYKSALELAAPTNPEAKKVLDAYNAQLKLKKPNQTEDDVFSQVVSTLPYNHGAAILNKVPYLANIKENKEKANLILEARSQAESKALNDHIDMTINSEEGLKAFNNNPDTKMLWEGANGSQRAFSVRDVLLANGIIDSRGNKIGDLKSKPKLLKALQQSYYADSYLSTPAKRKEMISNLARSFGESYDTVMVKGRETSYNSVSPTTGISTSQTYIPETLNPESKTAKFLNEARRNGIYDTFSWGDQSLSGDDSTIGRFLNDNYKDNPTYKNDLQKFYDKLPTTQVVGVTAQDKEAYNRLGALVTSQPGSTFTPEALSKNATINLRLEGDYVIASQNQDSTVKGTTTTAPVATKILKSDFIRNMPELANKLDFTTEAAFYNLDKLEGKVLKAEAPKFLDGTSKDNLNYGAQVILASTPKYTPYLTSNLAIEALQKQNLILQQRWGNFSDIVKRAVSQSDKYAINAQMDRDYRGNPELNLTLIDTRTNKVIHTMSNSSQINLDNFKKILDNTPQVFYGIMINDIFQREQQQMGRGIKDPSEPFNSLTTSLQ